MEMTGLLVLVATMTAIFVLILLAQQLHINDLEQQNQLLGTVNRHLLRELDKAHCQAGWASQRIGDLEEQVTRLHGVVVGVSKRRSRLAAMQEIEPSKTYLN